MYKVYKSYNDSWALICQSQKPSGYEWSHKTYLMFDVDNISAS